MASKSNHRRVRYDRILAVLLVLILLIVLLVKCCSSCSSNKNKKKSFLKSKRDNKTSKK